MDITDGELLGTSQGYLTRNVFGGSIGGRLRIGRWTEVPVIWLRPWHLHCVHVFLFPRLLNFIPPSFNQRSRCCIVVSENYDDETKLSFETILLLLPYL